MGIGAVAEPLVVVTLLFGGAWFNRNRAPAGEDYAKGWTPLRRNSDVGRSSRSSSDSGRTQVDESATSPTSGWRRRRVKLPFVETTLSTPNTLVFQDRLLSRLLRKFPFLVEAWYWALLYWVYQLGRAFTALTLVESTVDVARRHALQVIHLEQALGIFIERPVQEWFMARPELMHWINRIYSFIHIPGTIFFLVMLYYFTTTRQRRMLGDLPSSSSKRGGVPVAGPGLYESRRRAMALCNLIAFIVFTLWPCMPPRLLSDPEYKGPDADEAKSFGFVDTVHSGTGESSVWTTNRFCNQYAAMPSLHFGYSLLIGLTIATFPTQGLRMWKRAAIIAVGIFYPMLLLAAIVSTANHFVLDAVAGACVCGIAWNANGILLNLLVVEDYFLWLVRIHKPVNCTDPTTAVEGQYSPLMATEL